MEKGKILIIDDEEQLRSLVKRIVALEGFTVVEAPNLYDARKLLERSQIDVVLCESASFDFGSVERSHIQKVLRYTKGNKTKTAELLGVDVTTAYKNLDEYKCAADG